MNPPNERLDPRIGILNNGDFYAFAHGYDKPETRGTLAQVCRAIGVPLSKSGATSRLKKPSQLREYVVTVTPRIKTYADAQTFDEYTLTYTATGAQQAISKARQARRDVDGRYAVPATYKAKIFRGRR